MNRTGFIRVAIFRNGKEPKLKEVIENVTSTSENEHCIIVNSISRKGKRSRPNKQMFSKPEFTYVRIFDIDDDKFVGIEYRGEDEI